MDERFPATPMPFGFLLRRHRLEAELTQEALAERARVSARVVSDLERGVTRSPRAHTVWQLADALQLSPPERREFVAAAREGNGTHGDVDQMPIEVEEAHLDQPLPVGGFLGAIPSGPLIAREQELDRILDGIEAVQAGSGRLIVLAGEPGVGKTRMAQEVSLILRERGFLVAAGSCYETQHATAFFPFLDLLTALYRAAPSDIRTAVPRQYPYLPTLLLSQHLSLPRSVQQGAEDQERLFWSVVTFIQACTAHHPVALLVDDLHWADSSSLELLHRLARQTRNHAVLLLATCRDVAVGQRDPLDATMIELTRQDLLTRIPVRPLSEAETAQLVATVLNEQEISAEFASLLYGRTEGNPFLIQQVLRVLVERGDVYREEGRWTRKAIGELEVPESIRAAVGQRVKWLSDEAQQFLGEASVLGQTFLFDDLVQMGKHEESIVEPALEEVLGVGLVREIGADHYAFDHALTQEVLYDNLTARRRQRLHRAAGRVLEQLPERKRTQRIAELAWHFRQGDDPERALRYTMQAGDQAAEIYAYQEAERHYRVAIDLAQELENQRREAETGERLGFVLWYLNRWTDAVPVFEDALDRYHVLGDSEGEMRTARGLYWVWPGNRFADLIPRLQSVLDGAPESASPARAQLVAALANTTFSIGKYQESVSIAGVALTLAEASGDQRAKLDALHALALGFAETGQTAEATGVFEQMVALAEALDDAFWLALSLILFGWQYHMTGDHELALQTTGRGLEVARATGNISGIVFSTINLGEIAFDMGDWDQAKRYFTEAVPLGWFAGGATDPAANLLYLRLLCRDESAISELKRLTDAPSSWAARYVAEWEILTGKAESARGRLERGLEAGVEEHFRPGWEVLRAESYVMLGQLERAEDIVVPLAEPTTPTAYPADRIQVLRVLGMIRARQGRSLEARTLFERALARSEGYPFFQAQVHHHFGVALESDGRHEDARTQLASALRLFDRLGARSYAARSESVLATRA